MIDKASRIVSNAERECRLRAPVFTVDRNKEVTRPLHWSGVMHSHLSSDQPHHNVINNNNSGLATVYTMGFSEAQLPALPSLVMFCKENKFQMALVSWRSQTDSEQRHGAAVHLSSCVATCPAACHVPPHVSTAGYLHMSATRIQVTDSVHYVTALVPATAAGTIS